MDVTRITSVPARPRLSRKTATHTPQAFEVTTKLGVNLLCAMVAITSLVHLLPYQLEQQSKLHDIRSEVDQTASRVNELHTRYKRSFDPNFAKQIVQEQSQLIEAHQRKIVWIQSAQNSQ